MADYVRVIGAKDIPPGSGHVTEVNGIVLQSLMWTAPFSPWTTPVPIVAVRSGKGSSKEKLSPVLGTAGNTMYEQGSR